MGPVCIGDAIQTMTSDPVFVLEAALMHPGAGYVLELTVEETT